VAKTLDVGDGPSEVLVSPDGKKAYVACNFSNQVVVVDLASWKVEKTIAAGQFADGLAMAR
jgi:YVTN family beta-propeller protein